MDNKKQIKWFKVSTSEFIKVGQFRKTKVFYVHTYSRYRSKVMLDKKLRPLEFTIVNSIEVYKPPWFSIKIT